MEDRRLLALVAADGFESYAEGAELETGTVGLDGGVGFSAAWRVADGQEAGTTIVSPGLSYSNGEIQIDGGDRALQFTELMDDGGTIAQFASRQFDSSNSDTIYLSFLFSTNADDNEDGSGSNFMQVGLDNTALNNPDVSGLYRGTFQARIGASESASTGAQDSAVSGQTYFLVVRATRPDSDPGTFYNDVSLYLDPATAMEPATPDAHVTGSSGIEDATFLALRKANLDDGDNFQFDQFRIGTTYADVLPPLDAIDDDYTTTNSITEDQTLTIPDGATDLLANDSGAPVNLSDFDRISTNGADVTVNADGSFDYDPTGSATFQALNDDDPAITDTFTYAITDGSTTPTAGPANWDFYDGSGSLEGWTVLNGAVNFRSGNSGGMTAANGSGGFGGDANHETYLVQSPAFTLDSTTLGTTGNVLSVQFAGGAGDQEGQGQIYDNPGDVTAVNGGNSFTTGQKGLAFFNVDTGDYDATIFEDDNNGTDTRNFTETQLTDMGVTVGANYRLHYFDNDQGTWGWGQVNFIDLAASLEVPITDTATVSVQVTGVNDDPNASNDGASLYEVIDGSPASNSISSNVLANDTDVDDPNGGFTVTNAATVTGTYGTLELNTDGSYTYTLDDANTDVNALQIGESLSESFDYTMSDNHAGDPLTDSATLTVTILGANDSPLATDNAATVTEDTAPTAGGNLITDDDGNGTDSDPDHDQTALSVTQIGPEMNPANDVTGTYGTLEWNADGSYSYTVDNGNPTVNALGVGDSLTDQFTYTVADPFVSGDGLFQVVAFQLNNAGSDGDLNNTVETLGIWQALQANAAVPGIISAGGNTYGIGNFEVDIDDQVYFDDELDGFVNPRPYNSINSNGVGGGGGSVNGGDDLSVAANGFLTFTTAGTYSISAGSDDGRLISLTEAFPGSAPGYAGFTDAGDQLTGFTAGDNQVLYNDPTGHAHSTGVFDVAAGDVLSLETFFFERGGGDQFHLSIKQGADTDHGGTTDGWALLQDGVAGIELSSALHNSTDTATLTVTIDGTNDAPVATDDTPAAASENTVQTVDVLANDTDADDDPTNFSLDTVNITATTGLSGSPAAAGSASIVGNQLQFDPGTDFDELTTGETATVTIDYIMSDDDAATSTATVTLTINGENDGPIAVDDDSTDIGTVSEDGPATDLDVLANDTDPEGDTLTITSVDNTGTSGTVVVNPGGADVNYDPNGQFEFLDDTETATDTFTYTIDDGGPAPATTVGYWRMEQDDDPGAGFSVANEIAGGSNLDGANGSIEALNGTGFDDPIPQTGAANGFGLNGSPNINGNIAQYGALDTGSITLELYVRTNEGDARLIDSGFASGTSGYRIHQPNGVQVQYHVEDGAGGATLVTLNTGVNLDANWDHLAWTYDQGTGVGTVYLNGAVVGTNDGPNGRALVHNTSAPVEVGEGFDGGGPFSGNTDALVDELRISNVALPPAQQLAAPDPQTATVTVTIVGMNDAPVADAGGAYTIAEGDSLNLDASASSDVDIETLSYSWDINGDGTFGDATGETPTVSFADLQALVPSIDDGVPPGTTFDVAVQVSDGDLTDTATTTLTLNNAPPAASIEAFDQFGNSISQIVPGYDVTFTVSADDPSNTDDMNDFTYMIDFDGDGTFDQTATGPMSGVSFTTQYGSLGTRNVQATATDKDGGVSDIEIFQLDVVPVAQIGNDIVAGGTDGMSDRIIFYPTNDGVQVRYNNDTYPSDNSSFTVTPAPDPNPTRLIAFGRGSSDQIIVAGRIDANAEFDGGDGNDYLTSVDANDTLVGGSGNDILLAGEGDNFIDGGDGIDRLEGRSGDDVIFGGAGNDRLNGNAGDDILDGGADNDFLFGGLGDDLLVGRVGADTLNGHYGNDVILGGASADQIFGSSDNDLLIGGTAADRVRGDAGNDDLIGGTSALDDDIESALDAMMASLGTSLAMADANVDQQINEWFDTGSDREGFEPFADDGAVDDLTGDGGNDEFHTSGDSIRDFRSDDSMIP